MSFRVRVCFVATFVKICGITRLSDARNAVRAGANALGFIFAKSPRRISPARARDIARHVHPSVQKVGVFVDASADTIIATADFVGLDGAQLHGSEDAGLFAAIRSRRPNLFLAKAIRAVSKQSLSAAGSFPADAIVFDPKDVADPLEPPAGGATIPFSWLTGKDLARVIVAGGLGPENVGRLVSTVHPWGVDTSGGVESAPGKKDAQKLRAFVGAVRRAEGLQRIAAGASIGR